MPSWFIGGVIQGPRSNLKIAGGGGGRGSTVSDSILGDIRHLFLLTLYNSKNIGGHVPPGPLTLQSLLFFLFSFRVASRGM